MRTCTSRLNDRFVDWIAMGARFMWTSSERRGTHVRWMNRWTSGLWMDVCLENGVWLDGLTEVGWHAEWMGGIALVARRNDDDKTVTTFRTRLKMRRSILNTKCCAHMCDYVEQNASELSQWNHRQPHDEFILNFNVFICVRFVHRSVRLTFVNRHHLFHSLDYSSYWMVMRSPR